MTALALAGVSKAFGPVRVLQDVTLALAPGERLTLLGPSGCGKSVLLRVVVGLERPDGGSVAFDGRDVTRVPARDRGTALVAADRVLLPYAAPGWVGWPFFRRRPALAEDELASRLAVVRGVLGDDVAERLRDAPGAPPGGEPVPLAVARCLVRGARVLLLDDPLARLAATRRGEARAAIGDLLRRSGVTALYATHDDTEAAAWDAGVAVMRTGRIEQVGPYQEVYRQPATLFVAGYLGERAMNLVTGVVTADGLSLAPPAVGDRWDGWAVPLPPPIATRLAPGTRLTLGIRGEALRLAADGEDGVPAHILDVGPPAGGERRLVTCALGAAGEPGPVLVAELPLSAQEGPPADTPLRLAFDADQVHLFDAAGTRLDKDAPPQVSAADAPTSPAGTPGAPSAGPPGRPTVRVLAVADTRDRALYEHFRPERWEKERVELIVSCGDLPPDYLDYLVSVLNVPCFYVRGNHDTTYGTSPTGGAVNLHERLVRHKGVRFFGLEGSPWYNGGPAQYTEGQMRWMAFWAGWTIRTGGGVDVLVTHAAPRMCPLPERHCLCVQPPAGTPPANLGQTCYADATRPCLDMPDPAHRGFEALRRLVLKHQPRVLLHGHTHLGYGARPRELALGRTRVIDVYGHVLLDL